jgi:hypothetical protein
MEHPNETRYSAILLVGGITIAADDPDSKKLLKGLG